jgi:hypothetical protein
MNWKVLDSDSLRRLAKDRFGEALRIDQLTDEEIAEEMEAYDRCKEAHETQSAD